MIDLPLGSTAEVTDDLQASVIAILSLLVYKQIVTNEEVRQAKQQAVAYLDQARTAATEKLGREDPVGLLFLTLKSMLG